MAQLDEGSVGIKVLAGLPDGNGLPPIASDLLDNPHPIYAIVELRPHKEEHRLDTDSHTVSLRMTEIEPFDGEVADALRKQLRAQRERRTGVRSLPGIDGETPEAPAPATPEEGGWEEEVPTSEAQAATSATTPAATPQAETAVAAPPFTPPTPLAGKRRKA